MGIHQLRYHCGLGGVVLDRAANLLFGGERLGLGIADSLLDVVLQFPRPHHQMDERGKVVAILGQRRIELLQ
jgi:hypothetical protein